MAAPTHPPRAAVCRRAGVVAVGLVLAYAAACVVLVWSTIGLLAASPAAGGRLDVLVGLGAGAGAWAVLTWLTATSVLAVGAALARPDSLLRPLSHRLAPAVVRRLAVLALGVGIAGSATCAAAPAMAGTEGARTPATAPYTPGPDGRGGLPTPDRPADDLRGWTPDRPAPTHRTAREGALHLVSTAPRAGTSVADEVVVRRGDSLWDIAARHLGAGASAAEVAAEWPRWHAANRGVVGDDPDLIRPGQRLTPPRP